MRTCFVFRAAMMVGIAALCGGCDSLARLPRDADQWSERIRSSGVLLVGIAQTGDVRAEEGSEFAQLAGRERRIAEGVARRMGARVEWQEGSALPLLTRLQERDLPLVLALVPKDTPYKGRIALSRPYAPSGPGNTPFCIAVAPGENELLLLVDRVIEEERTSWEPEPSPQPKPAAESAK